MAWTQRWRDRLAKLGATGKRGFLRDPVVILFEREAAHAPTRDVAGGR